MRIRSILFRALTIAAAVAAPLVPAGAAKIAVIGTGDVAGALGPEFAAQGHTIVYGSRDPDRDDVRALVARTGRGASAAGQREAVADADIVVLAVPGTVAEQVTKDLGDLAGKIVIDPTNRVGRDPSGGMAYDKPANAESNAELVQRAAPGARVVKAFNTLNVRQMVDPETAGGPITIAMAGDDAEAKAVVAELISGMGLEPWDLGPLRFARVLEELLVVWAHSLTQGRQFNYYFRPQPPGAVPPGR
jgi:predicted dinucleotide-binding enzyme